MNRIKNNNIYAIILTFDSNIIFVDNLLCRMQMHWPKVELIYRIPYNTKKPDFLRDKYPDIIFEFIKTQPPIKETVLSLVSDLSNEDWIYWCIDDKFPLDINSGKANVLINWLRNQKDDNICGITFAKVRRLRDKNNLILSDNILISGQLNLVARKSFQKQFWMHQFFRVKIIKQVFESFPDYNFKAKLMDDFILNVQLDPSYKFYVTNKNLVVFGESASRGISTKSLQRSLVYCGIDNYSEKEFSTKNILIGRLNTWRTAREYFNYFISRLKNKYWSNG